MALSFGGNYACKSTVGEIRMHEKYADVRVYNSGKDKNGNWVTDFNCWCRFIGKAHTRCLTIQVKDQIEITQASLTTHFDKENRVQKLDSLVVWDFNVLKGENTTPEFARTTSRREQQPLPTKEEIEAAKNRVTSIEENFMNVPDNIDDLPFK